MKVCQAIELPQTILYAEKNVHQCWSCKRRVGQKEVTGVILGCPLNHISVMLPACEVAEQYMTWVAQCPCEKYDRIEGGKR